METLSLAAAAHSHGDRAAWISGGKVLSFAQAWALVCGAAARLIADGVRSGDRVAFIAEPTIASLATLFGTIAAGGTAVPLHPRLTATELAALRSKSGAALFLDEAAQRGLLRRRASVPAPPPRPAGVPFAILFTSGTSGSPKGVVLPARALAASAAAAAEIVPLASRERSLLCMPLAHVGGLSIVTRSLLARRAIVLEERFDAARVIETLREERISRVSVVPTMLDALLEEDRRNEMARLSLLLVGGAACPPSLLDECATRGVRARVTYGLTEASSMVTLSREHVANLREEGSGAPLPGVEVRIRQGRIEVRGPTMMSGYLEGPRLEPGAWLDTGDLGRLSADGRLTVLARRSDLIVTGGENVSPVEVEQVLESCAGIRRALVFGVPDARWGQLVAAAIVPDPHSPPEEAALRAELAKRLATFKRPRRLCFVETLPQTSAGKPDRRGAARSLSSRLGAFRY